MSTVYKVLLDSKQFKKLVKGEILEIWSGAVVGEHEKIELALSDLGFGIMKNAIQEAQDEARASSNPAIPEGD
jgi:hypothetical protein